MQKNCKTDRFPVRYFLPFVVEKYCLYEDAGTRNRRFLPWYKFLPCSVFSVVLCYSRCGEAIFDLARFFRTERSNIPERIVTEEENNIGNSYVKDVGVVRNNAMHPWSPMEILLNGKA
ncbi:hypothetical protein Rs2_39334 [Raphanus sativus]|nr:hypothetical protein Rs2_39334 [Raphanus sativus]